MSGDAAEPLPRPGAQRVRPRLSAPQAETARPSLAVPAKPPVDVMARFHLGMLAVLQAIMGFELALLIVDDQWLNAVLVVAIMTITLVPALVRHRLPIDIPPEFQVFAIIFVFAAVFLGEVRSYYDRIWWWDIALHASSGLLLGLLGLLLIYVLNEKATLHLHMRPHFVALFAFVFAVAMGALWEVFEFAMDHVFGTRMQKPMMGDPSGLTDTMWDLIVDALGAFIVSMLGWWHLVRGGHSFVEAWVRRFRRHRGATTGAR